LKRLFEQIQKGEKAGVNRTNNCLFVCLCVDTEFLRFNCSQIFDICLFCLREIDMALLWLKTKKFTHNLSKELHRWQRFCNLKNAVG